MQNIVTFSSAVLDYMRQVISIWKYCHTTVLYLFLPFLPPMWACSTRGILHRNRKIVNTGKLLNMSCYVKKITNLINPKNMYLHYSNFACLKNKLNSYV